nr:hypothetical protein [Tanacetum cinerariifolium]
MYPPTTSKSLAGDSSFESSAGPSHKRCRSHAATVTSSIYDLRALVPSHVDLLPPRKRFRDSISLEDSVEEDIDTDVLADIKDDVMAIEFVVDRDVEAGVDAGIGMEVDVRVDVEDELESSDRGAMEVRVDVVAGIDIPDGLFMLDVVECLEQTGQRELEARSLIAGGERASLLKQVASLERSNVRLRGNVVLESARADRELIKLMTERFQELTIMCAKMVLEEEDRVEKFIGGLPDNIQGNVIIVEPIRLQNAVHIANNLMDQKLKGYAVKNAENKRRAYTAGSNEKKGYDGPLPYCNKCKLHHEGPCNVKCGKCNKVRHMTRDCMNIVAAIATQRAPVVNQRVPICFECGRQGHYENECPKLKN